MRMLSCIGNRRFLEKHSAERIMIADKRRKDVVTQRSQTPVTNCEETFGAGFQYGYYQDIYLQADARSARDAVGVQVGRKRKSFV